MEEVLNSVIKFDLHIHSKASEYKESAEIVDQSTKENLSVLLSKLNEHEVALFSITDHNRFDPELYIEINNILSQADHAYPNVKAVLAGVEFDVVIDEGMDKCHIIGIFDANNESDNFRKIDSGLQTNLLKKRQDAYTKRQFEDILKAIGLNTILIASQRKDINNQSGKHNSLSDSTDDVEEIIRVGYINALEFQKPKIEGILLSNLEELSLPIALFSGSDCHDWSCYPYHSSKNKNKNFHHSRAKILPTFKGLIMAVTSPSTRFNCSENTNINFIGGLEINQQKIPLVNGINAIIGENGSGKTTLLKLINEELSEAHIKKLVNNNNLKTLGSINSQKIKYIEQGQIIQRFNDNTLFSAGEKSNFKELDNTSFKEIYLNYSNSLKNGIEASIKKQETINDLSKYEITFQEGMSGEKYYVNISGKEDIESTDNPHEKPLSEINKLVTKVKDLLKDDYYKPYEDELERGLKELKSIADAIKRKWRLVNYEATVKNIMHGCIDDYLKKIDDQSPSRVKEIREYDNKKIKIVSVVVAAIKAPLKEIKWPLEPPTLEGVTKNQKEGFYFNREAEYNGISMIEDFYKKMFVKDYNCIEKVNRINSYTEFAEGIRQCSSSADIDKKWKDNYEKFVSDAIKTNDYIMEGSNQQIGNTLGEMSLSYYKFFTQDTEDWSILIIDQPEDNISNNNISQKLIGYFDSIRDKKQIIFVTHNPLLVVNLDVDNVIFIKNDKGNLSTNNGCLEYEHEQTNILELIAQNMDGGKETIEKRLKVYGKNY